VVWLSGRPAQRYCLPCQLVGCCLLRVSIEFESVRALRKEETMRDLLRLATGIAITLASAASQAQDVNDAPFNEKWSPTEWGADDKVGAPNRTTPELVLKAVGLVKQGKIATLGKIYAADAPAFGTRSWKLFIPGMPNLRVPPYRPRQYLAPQRLGYL